MKIKELSKLVEEIKVHIRALTSKFILVVHVTIKEKPNETTRRVDSGVDSVSARVERVKCVEVK